MKAAIATQRVKFSPEEDNKLKDLVKTLGNNWKEISLKMRTRTPRQCRTRYQNYLAPGYFNGEWTKEEDDLLTEKFRIFGSRWKEIKKFFPARTANALKNRWNYYLSKQENEVQTLPQTIPTTIQQIQPISQTIIVAPQQVQMQFQQPQQQIIIQPQTVALPNQPQPQQTLINHPQHQQFFMPVTYIQVPYNSYAIVQN